VARPLAANDSLAGFREINGGGGYGSVSAKEAVFAMDPSLDYYAIIKFPVSDSTITVNGIKVGSVVTIREENGFAAYLTYSRKAVVRFFTDREIRLEMIKYIAVLLTLALYLRIQAKGSAQIVVSRWLACLGILVIFVLVNQVFLYSSSLVLFLIAPALAMIGLVILHLVTERVLLKRHSEREKTELREKISRDLHDDLASTLGSISIYSSTLKELENTTRSNSQNLSAKIFELTKTAMQSITDIIWMTAPRNDSLRRLLTKVSAMMFDVLTDNGIRFEENVELPDHEIILRDKLRNDTFLVLKEALNNVIRHASAQNVILYAAVKDGTCCIRLADDGKGFRISELPSLNSHGNGMINMRRRAAESGIGLQVQSEIGSGTRIEISFKI
jgi:signal transduction histidine kinase